MADPEYVSLLSLNEDTEELLNYNPEADANASIPPFEAGTYSVRVYFTETEPEKIWRTKLAKDGQKMLLTTVTLELYSTPEGKYDGRKVNHGINTYTSQFSNTNAVQALMQGMGLGEHIRAIGKQRGALANALTEALQGGTATAEAVFDWEARHSVETAPESGIWEEKFKKVGMTRFKKLEDGSYDPVADYNGVPVPARNVLIRFINPDLAVAKTAASAGQPAQAPRQAPAPASAAGASRPAPAPVAAPAPAPASAPAPAGGPPVPPRPRGAAVPPARAGAPVPAGQQR